MKPVLINGTGNDTITLWYWDGKRVTRKSNRNKTWIFVYGDPADLENLETQLDQSRIFFPKKTTLSDVYGPMDGLKIYSKPSLLRYLIDIVSHIGLNRKFRLYNADINPVLRYVAEHDLRFFDLMDPRDPDVDLPSVEIIPKVVAGDISSVRINNSNYERLDRNFCLDVLQCIRESVIVVYNNSGRAFSRIIDTIIEHGYDFPRTRFDAGSVYESYGRVLYKNEAAHIYGKISINSDSFVYSESGLDGLYQISRISSLPIEVGSAVTPGTAVSALEVAKAIRSGTLVPLFKDDHENEKSAEELLTTDRGGLVLEPDPGIYEDVYEIDFSSMYPSIIVRYNLSPETLSREEGFEIEETPYHVSTERKGFLSQSLEDLLETRLLYKSIKRNGAVYANRDIALKWLLLTSFGYTGYKNAKFGKIEVHEAITAMGRWALLTAMRIARSMGFEIIHGIVDSLWIKGDGDVNELLHRIKAETRIDIVLDGHYRWLVFLPARNGNGSPGRYMGLRTDGTYKFRGIEIRRGDIPVAAKKMQLECLKLLENASCVDEIRPLIPDLRRIYGRYMTNLTSMEKSDFLLNVRISRRYEDYRVNNLQKSVMKEFSKKRIELNPGESVNVIVSDNDHSMIDATGNGTIDWKFYRKYMDRAYECFAFMEEYLIPPNKGLYDPAFVQKEGGLVFQDS